MDVESSQAKRLINLLPSYDLRESLNGYLLSLELASQEIFRENQIQLNSDLLSKFLFCAVLRKLWSLINSQHWLLHDGLAVSKKSGVNGYLVGGRDYSVGSKDWESVNDLYGQFSELLKKLEMEEIIKSSELSGVLAKLHEGSKNGS